MPSASLQGMKLSERRLRFGQGAHSVEIQNSYLLTGGLTWVFLGARETLVTHGLKLLYHKWVPHSSDMEGWMLLPHCLWDCNGRAATRTFLAGSVPWGRSCWFFKYLKNRLSSIAIAYANIFDGINTCTNNLTWHSCIHSSIPPSTWDLSDGENSSQSWLVDIGQL